LITLDAYDAISPLLLIFSPAAMILLRMMPLPLPLGCHAGCCQMLMLSPPLMIITDGAF